MTRFYDDFDDDNDDDDDDDKVTSHNCHLFCPQNFKADLYASKQVRKRETKTEKKLEIRMNLRNFLNHSQLLWFCFCAPFRHGRHFFLDSRLFAWGFFPIVAINFIITLVCKRKVQKQHTQRRAWKQRVWVNVNRRALHMAWQHCWQIQQRLRRQQSRDNNNNIK